MHRTMKSIGIYRGRLGVAIGKRHLQTGLAVAGKAVIAVCLVGEKAILNNGR